jgi:hypothetical protein
MQLQTYGNFSGAGKAVRKQFGKYSIKTRISGRPIGYPGLYVKQLSVFAVFHSKFIIPRLFLTNKLCLYLVDYPNKPNQSY